MAEVDGAAVRARAQTRSWDGQRARPVCRRATNSGQEAQVDWYEAWAELSGEQVRLQVFSMRSMASGAAFHRAYHRATQQAFLDAHEHAFNYFGGRFRLLRYDNLKAAVKKILRGYRREETARFIAFRSHWRFSSEFCSPTRRTKKAASRARPATSGAITGCRCRRRAISRSSTHSCWPPAAPTNDVRSPGRAGRWAR